MQVHVFNRRQKAVRLRFGAWSLHFCWAPPPFIRSDRIHRCCVLPLSLLPMERTNAVLPHGAPAGRRPAVRPGSAPWQVDLAKELMQSAGDKIVLPTDVLVADKFDENAETKTVQSGDVPDGWMVRTPPHPPVFPLPFLLAISVVSQNRPASTDRLEIFFLLWRHVGHENILK